MSAILTAMSDVLHGVPFMLRAFAVAGVLVVVGLIVTGPHGRRS